MLRWKNKFKKLLPSSSVQLFFIFWTIFFAFFWTKALFFDKGGNLVAGHVNIWGDWAAHFTMAHAMAERGLILTSSPFLIGAKFSYPFVADMLSAILLQLNLGLRFSFLVPSFLLSMLLVFSLYIFYKTVGGSAKKAILSSMVFLLNGGIGFYYFALDLSTSQNPFQMILNPLHEYTRLDSQNIKWINIIDSMIIPQRAFLLGFPLTLLALTLIYRNLIKEKSSPNFVSLGIAGSILGLMPIIHTHSFLAVFIILIFWMVAGVLPKKNRRENIMGWGVVLVTTSLIALPLLNIYFMSQVSQGFLKFYPGWLAQDFKMNWIVFWFKNWFLVPLMAILGFLVIGRKNKKSLLIWGIITILLPAR